MTPWVNPPTTACFARGTGYRLLRNVLRIGARYTTRTWLARTVVLILREHLRTAEEV